MKYKGKGVLLKTQTYHIFRHSDEMVKRLEEAGLGYHIKAEQTTDKLGQ